MEDKKRMGWGFWRITALVLFVICFCWGALPLFASRLHTGCIAMMAVGLCGSAVCIWLPAAVALWQRAWATVGGKVALSAAVALAVALILLFIGVSVYMVVAACRPAPENATVVVLGAGLKGDRPSRTLRERLDAAVEYLNAHPEAPCIVSGGQGADEVCTEAAVMKAYLLEKGIAEDRIYVEDRSSNTDENLQFSRALIQERGLPSAVAVVTQEFHQCRAQAFARKAGFETVGAVTVHTPLDLLPSYWIRDFAGLCHMVVFG